VALAKLSVVIPTYNRVAILQKTLASYAAQTARDEILEILIIDDGSTDETSHVVPQVAGASAVPIRHLRQENSGLAAARNHGIREAKGEIVLFGDDDIIPAPRMVAEHLSWHIRHPDSSVAVVGPAYWSPELRPTPLMKWWGLNGIRFDSPGMKAGQRVSWAAGGFWNTSVKLRFLKENGIFDERFRTYGFEDSELTYRLNKKGYQALYNPEAIGYHYKRVKFADMCRYRKTIITTPNLAVYQTTEAGRCYLEGQARRRATRRYRVQKLITQCLVPILSPLKPLLDSHIPLPGFIYTAFLAYHGSLEAQRH
jgi:glycosyltransferase involved in cell wall biosynthesis